MKVWGVVKAEAGYAMAESTITHGQGGIVELMSNDGRSLGYKVLIEQLISEYGGNIPMQKLSVYSNYKKGSLAESVGSFC